jgi:winged helix DNA-binding protein
VSARILTTRELNRALLARQLLLRRSRLSLPRAVEQMGGIQAQYAPSAYIALWTRLEQFALAQLTRALRRRTVVQGTLLRGTIHIVSRRDYWFWAEAIRAPDRAWLARVHPKVAARDLRHAEATLRETLRERPRTREELIELIGRGAFFATDVNLVRVPPSGTWERRRANLYGLAEDWVGPLNATPEQGVALLIRRYLAAFGPSRPVDIRQWARLAPGAVEATAERMPLRTFRDEQGRTLVDLRRAPLPGADVRAPARLLPTWDATLLVHARRSAILPEEFRPLVFNSKNPASLSTFLVDGAVAGCWRIERARDRATLELTAFRRIDQASRAVLEAEGIRLAGFAEPDAVSYRSRWVPTRRAGRG